MAQLTEQEEDRIAQAAIRSAANRSVAILEKAFIRNGSGRYFVLRSTDAEIAARKFEAVEGD